METKSIFGTYTLRGLKLDNRTVMANMTRSRSDNAETAATDLTAKYYEQRATAGLIITEGTFVNSDAVGVINVPAIYTKPQFFITKNTF